VTSLPRCCPNFRHRNPPQPRNGWGKRRRRCRCRFSSDDLRLVEEEEELAAATSVASRSPRRRMTIGGDSVADAVYTDEFFRFFTDGRGGGRKSCPAHVPPALVSASAVSAAQQPNPHTTGHYRIGCGPRRWGRKSFRTHFLPRPWRMRRQSGGASA
jgi:hypothetical protein